MTSITQTLPDELSLQRSTASVLLATEAPKNQHQADTIATSLQGGGGWDPGHTTKWLQDFSIYWIRNISIFALRLDFMNWNLSGQVIVFCEVHRDLHVRSSVHFSSLVACHLHKVLMKCLKVEQYRNLEDYGQQSTFQLLLSRDSSSS